MTPLQRPLVLFWALWLTLVGLGNLIDAAASLGLVPADTLLVSGNYKLIVTSVTPTTTAGWLPPLLFAGVIGWQVIGAFFFWRLYLRWGRLPDLLGQVTLCWAVNVALWGAFLLADEFFHAFAFAPGHFAIFSAQLLSYVAIIVSQRVAFG